MFKYLIIATFITFHSFSSPIASDKIASPPQKLAEIYRHNYDFSVDWFTGNLKQWKQYLGPYKGRPGINYLEIGVFEGRSAIWMLENILTDPTAKLTGIDLFPEEAGDLKQKYMGNLEKSGYRHKTTTIQGYSQNELKRLPNDSFDIIYIDGDHTASGVLADAVLSWQLLKTGGLIIFDDYAYWANEKKVPDELSAKTAIDSFISAHRSDIDVIHRGYQLFARKLKSPPVNVSHGPDDKYPPIGWTLVGQYAYAWNWSGKHNLYNKKTGSLIKLSDKEKKLLEQLLISSKFGSEKLFLSNHLANNENFQKLVKRLDLQFTNIVNEPNNAVPGVTKSNLFNDIVSKIKNFR